MENKVKRAFAITILAVGFAAIVAAAFLVGRASVDKEADCPFELERMEIAPQTPTAYHHITGHHAPKHGVAVPLPPRRPQTTVALTGEELLRLYSKPGVLESLEMN